MKTNYVKLGAFILIGLIIFIGALYYLGTKQNLFVEQIRISSTLSNAQGIQEGSNVRLAGIRIGTVDDVKIVSDSTVKLVMYVDAEDAKFIKKDALISIGTDGLMGNKVVNISDGTNAAGQISDGDHLTAKADADLENIKNSVLENSRNLEKITENLVGITQRLTSGKGILGSLLVDSTMTDQLRSVMYSLDKTTRNTTQLTNNLNETIKNLNDGKGTAGKLLTDDNMSQDIDVIMDSLKSSTVKLNQITANIKQFSEKLNNNEGTIDLLLTDTTMAENVALTIYEARQRAAELEESIEIINNSWVLNLFGGKKKDKKKDKVKSQRASDDVITKN